MPYPALSLAETHARLTAPGAPFEMVEAEIRGERQRVWKNAPPTLRDVFNQGRTFGERTFLVYEGERATFEAFARAAVVFAHELKTLGVVKGDRVALAMRNLPEWPVVFFGTILTGAIAVPLNAWSTGPELQFMLTDSGAKILVADPERFDRILPHVDACPALKVILASRVDGRLSHARAESLQTLIGRTADWSQLLVFDLPDVALAPEDDATIFYTSGTTGKPKGALGTHRNVCSTIVARPYGMAAAALRRGETPAPPDPNVQKSALLSVPYFHVTGCMSTLIPSLLYGSKLVTMRRWDVTEALKVIEREKINSAGGVPTIAWQLIEHPDFAKYDTSSLEAFGYGGAPAPGDLVRRLKHAVPVSQLGTAWGMTETSAPFTMIIGEDYETRPTTCGYALPIGDMRIVGPNGEERPVGETGELWVRGPMVVKGYWQAPEATAQTFVGGGWLRTGDIAKLDEEGFCYIVDRAKDMLIRGGENIYCVEVENALAAHPAVIDAAVVGRPHQELGEEPVAVVTLKPGAGVSEADLRAFCLERIAAFKTPVRIILQEEMLPRNANGKILKRELRKMFAG